MHHHPEARVLAALALVALVLGPSGAYGCVDFKAQFIGTTYGFLEANIWDNVEAQCTIAGAYPSPDGLYHFNCVPGYSATFDSNSGTVVMINNHGVFQFLATDGGGVTWSACEFDCLPKECKP